MRVGKSLLMIMMGIGFSSVSIAQEDDQDLQGRVQYEERESKPTVKGNPSKPEVVEGEMEMSTSMTRLFENNLADPEQEVEVLRVIEDKAFIQSLSGENEMPKDFEYKDDKFVLKYKRSGDEEKIKAEGDPSEFVAKYNAFRQNQGMTPETTSASNDQNLYAEPEEVNTSTRGVDAKTRARNYEPQQTEIVRIGVPMESAEACPMNNNSVMIQKQIKTKRSCPGHSMNKGRSSTEEYNYNSSGSKMKRDKEGYKSN
ncbi:MAG: hypothetical protein J7604_14060 [Sporocytophaga sp.]|uniref:hypothetical protein n=1 Tax=Sporocytophaga sp. TaxID=2231183 RepID=UPI001AFF817E|nr:hypothetical protein [Sporocytophaga sp.]MBO9701330.1 hypothetical protein [Sporocytophaga sp.]